MPPPIIYWIKFTRDREPQKLHVKQWEEFFDYIRRWVYERGPIEWMIQGD